MRRLILTVAVILATVTTMSVAWAQSGQLEISWHTIDGGGTTASSEGDLALSGTMGQPDAAVSSGGIYTVRGGFWGVMAGSPAPASTVYLPLIRK